MLLVSGRKQEYSEKTSVCTGRTCKLNAEKPGGKPETFTLWGNSAIHCSTVPPRSKTFQGKIQQHKSRLGEGVQVRYRAKDIFYCSKESLCVTIATLSCTKCCKDRWRCLTVSRLTADTKAGRRLKASFQSIDSRLKTFSLSDNGTSWIRCNLPDISIFIICDSRQDHTLCDRFLVHTGLPSQIYSRPAKS